SPAAVGVAVAGLLGWTVGYAASALRRGWIQWVVTADVAVVAALCLGYRWLVPAAALPGWSTWLAVVASSAVVVSQLSPWPVLGVVGTVAVPAGYAAGSTLAGHAAPEVALLLVAQGTGAGLLMAMMRRRARAAVAVDMAVTEAAVPAEVGAAFADAVAEALRNVVRHAGTGRVTLRGGSADGVVRVEVADDGRGFDPAQVATHRRGLRESVV